MLDFEVQKCTRKCAKTDRELKAGETFFSMLVAEGGDVIRQDFCEEAWEGPTSESIGWWKSQMPSPSTQKMHWAPQDVMLHFFEQLDDQSDKADLRYVLALLMIRRRILKLEDGESEDDRREWMSVYCSRNENHYKVAVVVPTPERIEAIQQELAHLLYADAA